MGSFPELVNKRGMTERKRELLRRLRLLDHAQRLGLLDSNAGHRAASMTFSKMRSIASRHGLRCLSQETVNWGTKKPIDCFSTLVLADSDWPPGEAMLENTEFMRGAAHIRRLSRLYGGARLT